MSSVNKVILIGNLGQDPETKYLPSGIAVCNISVATSRTWKNKETGEKMEETEWSRVTLFDRRAEVAGEYLQKGSKVYIEGYLKTRKWQDKDGADRFTTEIIADDMKMLSPRQDGGGQQQAPQQRQAPPPQRGNQSSQAGGQRNQAPRTQQRQAPPDRGGRDDPFGDMPDDIPF